SRGFSSTVKPCLSNPAIRQPCLGSLLQRLHCVFHCDGAWEQDVVLQVDVLVEILLKLFQSCIVRQISRARSHRRGEVTCELLDLREQLASVIVLAGHHLNGMSDGSETTLRQRGTLNLCLFKLDDVGEKHVLFLAEMMNELFIKLRQHFLERGQVGLR